MRVPLALLSRLWLREPDAPTLASARGYADFAGVAGDPAELSAAYLELFLLNVYPYGTIYTDPAGELNGPGAQEAGRSYSAGGYEPAALPDVGAPDHAGLCLGYLAHLWARGEDDPAFLAGCLNWIPVCALAIEREPAAHPFYVALARATRHALLARSKGSELAPGDDLPDPIDSEAERHLFDIVRFLLAPARCGIFLSRSTLGRLGRSAGLRLPFASRLDVGRALLGAAGESALTAEIFHRLDAEAAAWETSYGALAREHPPWAPFARRWIVRAAGMRRTVAGFIRMLDSPLDLEYIKEPG